MRNILNTLPVQRIKPVLFLPFWRRTFLDHSGYGNHGTPTDGHWARVDGVDSYVPADNGAMIEIANSASLNPSAFTWFFFGKNRTHRNQRRMVSKRDVAGRDYEIYTALGNVTLRDSTVLRTIATDVTGLSSMAISVQSGQVGNFYGNGVHIGAFDGVTNITIGRDLFVGGYYTPANLEWIDPISAAILYPGLLIADEISATHAYMMDQQSPIIPFDRRYFDFGSTVPNGDEGGIVASYDLGVVSRRSCADKSGNGNHGDLVGSVAPVFTEAGRALSFDGNEARVELASDVVKALPISFSAVVRPRSAGTTGRLLDNGKMLIYFRLANRITLSSDGGATKIDSLASSVLYGKWHHVVCTRDAAGAGAIYIDGVESITGATGTPVAAAAVTFGNRAAGDRGWDGDIRDAVLYNRVLSLAEIKADYNKLARRVMWDSGLERVRPTLEPATSGELSNSGYEVLTGSHEVNEDPLTGEHYIECVAAGVIWRPNSLAHGTIRLRLLKALGSSTTSCMIYASVIGSESAPGQNGYLYQFNSSERSALWKTTAGIPALLHTSAADYITINTVYDVVIPHDSQGAFTVYIKGGVFSDWTLVDMAGGSGTNPITDNTHTTSKYLAFDLDTGDRVYLDRQYLGVYPPV